MIYDPNGTGISSAPTVITGIVHPSGSGGVQVKGKGWKLVFDFETWRSEDGTLHANQLRLSRPVSEKELHCFMDWIGPYKILKLRVVFTEPASAEILRFMFQLVNTDYALAKRVAEMQRPKTRKHKLFGVLTFNRSVIGYTTTTKWLDKEIRLHLDATDDTSIEAALQVAVTLWEDQSHWNQIIQDYVVQKLLELLHNTWLDETVDEITSDEFKSRMILRVITISPGGEFEFWLDSKFGVQSILVRGNQINGLTDVEIHD